MVEHRSGRGFYCWQDDNKPADVEGRTNGKLPGKLIKEVKAVLINGKRLDLSVSGNWEEVISFSFFSLAKPKGQNTSSIILN